MIIIDAKNSILGRIATFAAKKALLGEEVAIVNCEKAMVTGTKENVLSKFKERRDMGNPQFGPYYPKTPEGIVKRAVRGMLPYKQHKGAVALKRVKVYEGIPENLKDKELIKVDGSSIAKVSDLKYGPVWKIAAHLGARK